MKERLLLVCLWCLWEAIGDLQVLETARDHIYTGLDGANNTPLFSVHGENGIAQNFAVTNRRCFAANPPEYERWCRRLSTRSTRHVP